MPLFDFVINLKKLNVMNTEPNKQQDEISDYLATAHQMEIEDARQKAKTTRNWLLGIAAILLISELIGIYRAGLGFNNVSLIFLVIEVGLFVGLAIWAMKEPYKAALIGLIAYILLIVVSAVFAGMAAGGAGVLGALLGGIIVKIIIIMALFRQMYVNKKD